MYENKFDENLTVIQVDAETVLLVNCALEVERANRMKHLLMTNLTLCVQKPFDYSKYPTVDLTVRCYDAAAALAKKYNLTYVEGLVVITDQNLRQYPYAHGWCVDRNGVVVDPSLHKHQHKMQFHYLGIPFKMSYVDEQFEQCGYYGILDGRQDGKAEGVYFDPPSMWLKK